MRKLAIALLLATSSAAWAGPTTIVTDTEAALAETMAMARVLTVRPSTSVQQLDGAQQGTVLRDDVRMGGKNCNLTVAPVAQNSMGKGSKLLGTTNMTVVQRAPSTIVC